MKALLIASVYATSTFAWGNAHAILIRITDPKPRYVDSVEYCEGVGDDHYVDYTSTASISTRDSLDGNDFEFDQAFDAWNGTNANGKKWTLVDGGDLPGGRFDVSIFRAVATEPSGGLEIEINWTYGGRDKDDYKWVQGLYDNYTSTKMVPPRYALDVGSTVGCGNETIEKQCPPIYPKQYFNRHFFDFPLGPWPNGFFDAYTFLSKANFATRTLTIYEGVSYGFQLSAERITNDVPEPPNLLLFLIGASGVLMVGFARKRTPRRRSCRNRR